MSKQDRQGIRHASEVEQRYGLNKRMSEVMGVANDARDLAKETSNAFKGLSQDEIFKRLTNNGEWQGLYKANGEVYINASYIKTGELSADLIKTGAIKSSNYTESDGLLLSGMSIDLDRGIINSARFKLNELGEIEATAGKIGGFEIGNGIKHAVLNGQYLDTIEIDFLKIATTVEGGSTVDHIKRDAALSQGMLNITNDSTMRETEGSFDGTFALYTENGRQFTLRVDPDTMTVKVVEVTPASEVTI